MRQPLQCSNPLLRTRWGRALLFAAAGYLLLCLGCAGFQRRFIYFPQFLAPERVDQLSRGENLERWSTPSGRPIGWKRLSVTQPAFGQVLVMHGNAGCAFQCGHYANVIQQAASMNVFVVEYPGYADRPGKPTERSLDEAAAEALTALADNGPVYLLGESLGTGVATYLAGRFPELVAGVVLLAPYNRLTDVAQAHMPIFPMRLLLCDRFPAEEHLRKFHGPVAVLLAGADTVVPSRFGRRLYDSYQGPKRLWEFPTATHDTLMSQSPDLWKEVIAFWRIRQ